MAGAPQRSRIDLRREGHGKLVQHAQAPMDYRRELCEKTGAAVVTLAAVWQLIFLPIGKAVVV